MRRFEQRGGETRVIAEMLGRRVVFTDGGGLATIEDVAIEEDGPAEWEIAQLFVRKPRTGNSPFGKGPTTFVSWSEVRERATSGEAQSAEQLIAAYSEMKPAEPGQHPARSAGSASAGGGGGAAGQSASPTCWKRCPRATRCASWGGLDDDRAADVLDQMQPDDAADLIAQLSDERGEHLLELMQPEEADDVRMLLTYEPDTAGGLMTTEPIIVSADATVAEGLALIRRHEARAGARRGDLRHVAAIRTTHRPLPRHGALPADAPLSPARTPRHPARTRASSP